MNKNRPKESHVIMGCHSLEEVLKHCPERFLKVFHLRVTDRSKDRKTNILDNLQKRGIQLIPCSKNELETLCQSTSHQGIAASLKERAPFDLTSFLETNQSKLVVALDSIYDPHNLGAILRACECFDVGLVMWSKNRGAALSPTVSKTSSSATEFVPIHVVSNLATSLDKFIAADYTIIGVHVTADSRDIFTYEFPEKSLLILGSEGEGIRPILQKKLHDSIMIPMHGKIDSLNVSQAAALTIGLWKSRCHK